MLTICFLSSLARFGSVPNFSLNASEVKNKTWFGSLEAFQAVVRTWTEEREAIDAEVNLQGADDMDA